MSHSPGATLVVSHAYYHDQIGGSFRLATELAEDLAASGLVAFVCADPDGSRPAQESRGGVDVYRYQPANSRWPLSRLRTHITRTAELVAQLHRRYCFHSVVGHSPLQTLGAIEALPANLFVNYTVHSPFDDELLTNRKRAGVVARLAARMARRVERKNLRRANLVQTLSEYTLRRLREKYTVPGVGSAVVIPGWVDLDRFGPLAGDRATLGDDESEPSVPTFFCLRRLEQRMGVDLLIEAAASLHREGHRFRLLIGGSGSLREQLASQVRNERLQETVRFLGRVDEADLPRFYAAADCFVLPTRALECFGLIVLESFACGTPVISSDAAALPEIAAVQGDEWMVPAGDADAFTNTMRKFLLGRLRATVDLRAIAARYGRSELHPLWRDATRPPEHTASDVCYDASSSERAVLS